MHTIAPFDPEAHAAFVFESWMQRPRRPDGSRGPARRPRHLLADAIRLGVVHAVVAHVHDDPDSFVGWAAVEDGGAVWWVYVRDEVTLPSGKVVRFRREGVARTLLAHLGALTSPIVARFSSPYVDEINRDREAPRIVVQPLETHDQDQAVPLP